MCNFASQEERQLLQGLNITNDFRIVLCFSESLNAFFSSFFIQVSIMQGLMFLLAVRVHLPVSAPFQAVHKKIFENLKLGTKIKLLTV